MIFKKTGGDIFSLERDSVGPISDYWGGWHFRCKTHDWARGYTGIYFISYGSDEHKKVIYAGMYAGNGKQLKSSDVVEQRWRKHLRTLTLLDRAAKSSSISLFNKLKEKAAGTKYADFPLFSPEWLHENHKHFFLRSNNCNTSCNRMSFAIQNWPELLELARKEALLDFFNFHFVCLGAEYHKLSKKEIAPVLHGLEKQVIEQLDKRLPANVEYKSTSGQSYFHYLPDTLIEDSSYQFTSLLRQLENDLIHAYVGS
jgi:hypothetical protein